MEAIRKFNRRKFHHFFLAIETGATKLRSMKSIPIFFPLSLSEISYLSQSFGVSSTDIVNFFGGIKNYAKLRNIIVAQKLGNN